MKFVRHLRQVVCVFLLSLPHYSFAQPIVITNLGNDSTASITVFDPVEISVALPDSVQVLIDSFLNGNSGINPYDYQDFKARIGFSCEENLYSRTGFYYSPYKVEKRDWVYEPGDFPIRVRFCPPKAGRYTAKVFLAIKGKETPYTFFDFEVKNDGSKKGHISINRYLSKFQYSQGGCFLGIGQNIGYVIDALGANIKPPENCLQWYCRPPECYDQYRGFLEDLADHGANLVRLRLDPFDFPIQWPAWKMYSTDTLRSVSGANSLRNYHGNQRYMWEFDRVIRLCEKKGIYIILNILLDQSWSNNTSSDIGDFNWAHNPYSSVLGNDVKGIQEFFRNDIAKSHFRNFLTYIEARWGYSTQLAAWQLINETENLAGYDSDEAFRLQVNTWICEMKDHLSQFYPRHPVTNGSIRNRGNQPDCLDLFSQNSYNASLYDCGYSCSNFNQRSKSQTAYTSNGVPFFWGELGMGHYLIDRNMDLEFHNALWATTMMGGISSGLYWHDFEQRYGVNHRANFDALRIFSERINWNEKLLPGQDYSEGGPGCRSEKTKKVVYSYWMANQARNLALGWAVNASSWWLAATDEFVRLADFATVRKELGCLPEPNGYDILENTCHPQIHIKDLLPLSNYEIEIFDTHDPENKLLERKDEMTDVSGNLKFRRFMPSRVSEPFYPDYAFVVRTRQRSHSALKIFPVPATDFIELSFDKEPGQKFSVTLLNLLGQPVLTAANTLRLNVGQLTPGVYVVEVVITGKKLTSKVVIGGG